MTTPPRSFALAAPPSLGPRVGFHGVEGAFGHVAARAARAGAVPVGYASFPAVIEALLRGEVAAGVIPVENRIVGSVVPGQAAIQGAARGVRIRDHVRVPVHLCVLGVPGSSLDDLRVVRSHPVALAQCARFFATHPRLVLEPWGDTGGAARDVSRDRRASLAALASPVAASHWGLDVLARDVQDVPDNWTRFAVVERA